MAVVTVDYTAHGAEPFDPSVLPKGTLFEVEFYASGVPKWNLCMRLSLGGPYNAVDLTDGGRFAVTGPSAGYRPFTGTATLSNAGGGK